MNRNRIIAGAGVALALLGRLGDAAEGRIPISGRATITQSGSYFLSQDIDNLVGGLPAGHAIEITADNVSLSLDGHTIKVSGAFNAVYVTGTNVEIRGGMLVAVSNGGVDGVLFVRAGGEFRALDLTITGFQGAGIAASGCSGASARLIAKGNTVQGVSVGTAGIYLECMEASRIEQNQLREAFVGVWLEATVDSIIANNVISQNDDDGLLLANGSSNNLVERNIATRNGGVGIHVYSSNTQSCTANSFVHNNASKNTLSGISLDGATGGATTHFNQVSYNTTSFNGSDGILVELVGFYNALDWNQSAGNGGAGIKLKGNNNVFSNNRAQFNGSGGYVVTGSGNINVVINTTPPTQTNY